MSRRSPRQRVAKAQAGVGRGCIRDIYSRRNRSQRKTRPDSIHYAPASPRSPTSTPATPALSISTNVLVTQGPLLEPNELPKDQDACKSLTSVLLAQDPRIRPKGAPSTNQPTGTGRPCGRPRKHRNVAAVAEAKKESDRRRYLRSQGLVVPAEFIHYEPAFPDATPVASPDVDLRINVAVPVPQCPTIQPNEPPEHADRYKPQLAANDVEAAAVLSQLRRTARDRTNEGAESEQRILQQTKGIDARTLETLLEMQATIAGLHTSLKRVLNQLGVVEP
ncbi:hypothetical protein PSPO01_16036 [Paraphaeosphaeria sporulosa]